MPTFLDPLNGISQSEALAESAVAANIDRVILMAYELWHPSMTTPVRVVADHQNLTATLEADAPRNASESVTFTAARIDIQRPTESDQAESPQIRLTVDNVTDLLTDALRTARQSDDPAVRDAVWEVIERVYASDDTTAPHRQPVFKVNLRQATTGGPTATFVAAYRDTANLSVPTITFTPDSYPGLAA